MLNFLVYFCVMISFVYALLHLSLIAGAPLGEYLLGGQHKIFPVKMRMISLFFVFYWIVVGISYTALYFPMILLNTVFTFYAIFANGFFTKSRKEKVLNTPISLVFFLISLAILLWNK